MSYFPCDIPYMSKEELEENGIRIPKEQPEKKHGRIFQEIVVEYPSYNTYPEYKGKPYFSIKYTENGQEFIGYGTYKQEVLSEYLKEYFMPSAQPYTAEEIDKMQELESAQVEKAYELGRESAQPEWIPVMDGDGVLPEVDEDGYSDYVLVSFSNVYGLDIGQYREDENGGAFYSGDDDDPYTKIGAFVNAWMPLPKPYRGGDTT